MYTSTVYNSSVVYTLSTCEDQNLPAPLHQHALLGVLEVVRQTLRVLAASRGQRARLHTYS